MRFVLLTFGKSKFPFADAGVNHYAENIRHHAELEIELLRDQASDLDKEAEKILEWLERKKCLDGRTRVVLLDEAGNSLNSVAFAKWMEQLETEGVSRLVFIIGGAFGFGGALKAKKFSKISLSPMTFPHDLARVVLLEQVYRALHIRAGTKYHHT